MRARRRLSLSAAALLHMGARLKIFAAHATPEEQLRPVWARDQAADNGNRCARAAACHVGLVWQEDDGLLPHHAAFAVLHVVHLVEDHPRHLPQQLPAPGDTIRELWLIIVTFC